MLVLPVKAVSVRLVRGKAAWAASAVVRAECPVWAALAVVRAECPVWAALAVVRGECPVWAAWVAASQGK